MSKNLKLPYFLSKATKHKISNLQLLNLLNQVKSAQVVDGKIPVENRELSEYLADKLGFDFPPLFEEENTGWIFPEFFYIRTEFFLLLNCLGRTSKTILYRMLMHFFNAFFRVILNPLFLCIALVLTTTSTSIAQKKNSTQKKAPSKSSPAKSGAAKNTPAATTASPKTASSKKGWNNALSAAVHIDQRSGTQTLTIDANGVLQLTALPEILEIDLPEKNQDGVSIVFNKDKNSFTLSMDAKDSAAHDGSVPQLHPSDINFGRLDLYFHEGELIRIGDRYLVSRPKVDKTKPYIKINLPVEADADKTDKTKKVTQKLLPDIDTTDVAKIQKCLLCYVFPKCDSTNGCETGRAVTGKDSPSVRPGHGYKPTRADSSSRSWFAKIKERYRPVTVIDWNQDNNQQKNYLLYPDGKMVPIIDIRRRQKMQSWIIIRVNSQDSTVPKAEVNGMASSKFEPTDTQVKALDNLGQPSGGTAATPSAGKTTNGSAEKKVDTTKTKTGTSPVAPTKIIDAIVIEKSKQFTSLKNLQKDSLLTAFYMKAGTSDTIVAMKNLTTIFPNLDAKVLSTVSHDLDSLITLVKGAKKAISTKPSDRPLIVTEPDSFGKQWKTKLIALDMALEEFNERFVSVDFRIGEYSRKLTDLREGMKHCLGIAIADNEDDLKNSLLRVVTNGADSASFDELTDYVNIVTVEYKKAIHKTSTRSVKYLYVQVPDADQFMVKLSTEKPSKDAFNYTFSVVGGFKIDVSAGPFFSGLHNSTYVPYRAKFSYADSRDTVFTRSNAPVDSLIYTGRVIDTFGYLIKTNRNRLSYGVGFFAHGYWRSGGAFNSSLTMGFVLNNDGQVFGMLGLSALFANLKNRLVITAGGCVGKVKTVSASVSSYQYRSDYAAFENGRQVYLNRHDVPRFYDTSTTTEIPTYDKLKVSYFVALSFNLGSVKQ